MIEIKNKFIFLIITLFICQKIYGQQDNDYYQKGVEIVLESLIQENPKIVYHLTHGNPVSYTSKNLPISLDCKICFDDLKQINNDDSTKIIIPEKFKNRIRKYNFLNKIIYGRRLFEFHIEELYKGPKHVVFRANFYGKNGGIFFLIQFKNNSLEINELCKEYSIY